MVNEINPNTNNQNTNNNATLNEIYKLEDFRVWEKKNVKWTDENWFENYSSDLTETDWQNDLIKASEVTPEYKTYYSILALWKSEVDEQNNDINITVSDEEEEYNSSNYDSSDDEIIKYNGKEYDYKWIEKEGDELEKIAKELEAELERFKNKELSEVEEQNFLKKKDELSERWGIREAVANLYFDDDSDSDSGSDTSEILGKSAEDPKNEQEKQNENQELIKKETLNKLDSLISKTETKNEERLKEVEEIFSLGEDISKWKSFDLQASGITLALLYAEAMAEANISLPFSFCYLCQKNLKQDIINNFPQRGDIFSASIAVFHTLKGTTGALMGVYIYYYEVNEEKTIYICHDCYSSKVTKARAIWKAKKELVKNSLVDKSSNGEIIGYRQELTSLKKNFADWAMIVNDQLEGKNLEIKNLTEKNDEIIEKGKEAIKNERESKTAIILNLKSEKEIAEKDLKSTISLKEQALTDIDNKNKDLEREKEELKNKIRTLADEKQLLTEEYIDICRVKNDLERQNLENAERMKKAMANPVLLSPTKVDLDKLKEKFEELEKSTNTLEEQLATKKKENDELWEKAKELDKQNKSLIKSYQELELKNIAKQGIIDSNLISLQEKKDELKKAQNACIDIKGKMTDLEKDIAELKKELDNTKTLLDSANRQLETKEQEISRLEKELKSRETAYKSLDDLKAKLVEEKLELGNEKKSLENKISEKNLEIKQKEEKVMVQTERLDTATSERNAFEKEVSDLKAEKQNLTNEIKKKDEIINRLDKKISKLQEKKTELETEIQKLTEALDKATKQARIALLGNLAQGALDYLPIPEKWRDLGKKSIQAGSAYGLIKDLPGYTYEGLWMIVGLGIWYAGKALKYRIFGRKEINKIAALREEIQDSDRKQAKLKEENKELRNELKEVKASLAESKEEVKPVEISNQETTENFSENTPKPKKKRKSKKK